MSTNRIKAKIGDIIEIPLSTGQKAFAQFVFKDKENGELIQVKDLILGENSQFEVTNFEKAQPLFKPVITSIYPAIKYHGWKIVDTATVNEFKYPGFLHGSSGAWMLWNGEKYIDLGEKIPDMYAECEELISYSTDIIENRIIKKLNLKNYTNDSQSTISSDEEKTFLNTYMFYGDHAEDFTYTLADSPSVELLRKVLTRIADTEIEKYIEAPDASEALIAAEVVAYLKGNPSHEITNSFQNAVRSFKVYKEELNELCVLSIKAVKRIMAESSELKELWKQSEEYNEWENAANDLLKRLG